YSGARIDAHHLHRARPGRLLAVWLLQRGDHHVMAPGGKRVADARRQNLWHDQRSGDRMREHRVMETGAGDGGRFDGWLHVHAELHNGKERLQHRLRLIVAAGRIPREERLAVFHRECRVDGVARAFTWSQQIHVAIIEIETRKAVVEDEAGAIHHDAAAE